MKKKEPNHIEESVILIKSLHKISLSKFIDAYVDGDLSVLIVQGTPSEEQLITTWNELILEYNDAIGGSEKEILLDAYTDFYTLHAKVSTVEKMVEALRKFYVKKWADRLNKILHKNFSFDVSNREQYDKDLAKCLACLAPMKLDLQEMSMNLEEIQGEESDEKPSREHFSKLLISLSDFSRYEIRDNISVYTFCERVRRMNEYYKSHKLKEETWEQ